MEEKNEIEVMSGIKEKKQYDSFIYSLPFKSGAIISSLVIFVLGITCVIAFMWLWEEDIYSMTANEAAEYIAHYGGGKANIPPLAEALINLRYAVVPIGITLGILYLVDIVFIFAAIGHKRGSNELVKLTGRLI